MEIKITPIEELNGDITPCFSKLPFANGNCVKCVRSADCKVVKALEDISNTVEPQIIFLDTKKI